MSEQLPSEGPIESGLLGDDAPEVAPVAFEFDGFLSYATRGNYVLCRRVEAFLEGFHKRVVSGGRVLRPLNICRDGSDLRQWLSTGPSTDDDPLWRRIVEALERSRRLVVLCSQESVASEWVNREVAWMLENRGADHVWLVMAAGEDPAGNPKGVVPKAAIEAGLHKRQIWYDLRQWRGVRDERVRHAEDELVRLAVDLHGLPAGEAQGLASVWQREEAGRARRLAGIVATAALAVVAGAAVAAWQFGQARTRALQAQGASQVRVAEASLDRSPLQGALVASEWQAQHVSADSLAVGWRLLGSEVPEARVRGLVNRVVDAGWTPDGRVWAVDAMGNVSLSASSALGHAERVAPSQPAKVAAAQSAADSTELWLAGTPGVVLRQNIVSAKPVPKGAVCKLPSDDVRYIWVAPDGSSLLVSGYKEQAYECDPRLSGTEARVLGVSGGVVSARFDVRQEAWLLVTDQGGLWRAKLGQTAVTPVQIPVQLRERTAFGSVNGASFAGDQRLAVSGDSGVWIGRPTEGHWTFVRVSQVRVEGVMSFSPDGERLALADPATGRVLVIRCDDGEVLADLDHRAQFFMDPVSAETLADRPSKPESMKVSVLSWSPDGLMLATLQQGQGIRLWSVGAGSSAAPRRLKGHPGAERLIWSPKGDRLLSIGDDGDLVVWPRQGVLQEAHRVLPNDRLYAVALEPTRRVLALASGEAELLLLHADGLGQHPRRISGVPRCGSADADERRIDAAVAFDASGRLWWLRRDGGVSLLTGATTLAAKPAFEKAQHWCSRAVVARLSMALPGVALVDDGRRLVVLTESGLRVLDEEGSKEAPSRVAASAGGRWIAVGSKSGVVTRWNLLSAQRPQRSHVLSFNDSVMCLALDESTGGVLATSKDGSAMWQSGQDEPFRWSGDGQWMEECALAEGTAFVASASGRLWRQDLRQRLPAAVVESRDGVAHIGPLTQLFPMPGSDLVLTGGGVDGQVSVWTSKAGRRLATAFMGGTVTGLTVDRAKGRLIAVGEGGRVSTWPLSVADMQSLLLEATSANLSPSERVDLLGESADAAYMRYADLERKRSREPLPRDWRFRLSF